MLRGALPSPSATCTRLGTGLYCLAPPWPWAAQAYSVLASPQQSLRGFALRTCGCAVLILHVAWELPRGNWLSATRWLAQGALRPAADAGSRAAAGHERPRGAELGGLSGTPMACCQEEPHLQGGDMRGAACVAGCRHTRSWRRCSGGSPTGWLMCTAATGSPRWGSWRPAEHRAVCPFPSRELSHIAAALPEAEGSPAGMREPCLQMQRCACAGPGASG